MSQVKSVELQQVEDSIRGWVVNKLNVPQAFLGNLPVCPFARESLLKGELHIESHQDQIFTAVETVLKKFSTLNCRVAIVATSNFSSVSTVQVSDFIARMREQIYRYDLWIMSDHPERVEVIDDFSFNHSSLLLFFVQRLSEVVHASEILMGKGYYAKWPKENFERVVGQRMQYWQRLQADQG